MTPKKNSDDTVRIHVEYIRKMIDTQNTNIGKIFDKIDDVNDKISDQAESFNKKFTDINKRVSKAEGYAKGAVAVGGAGGVLGFLAMVLRFIFK